MAILSLLCMTYVMGLLVIAKSYTFENKYLRMRFSKRPVTGRSTMPTVISHGVFGLIRFD